MNPFAISGLLTGITSLAFGFFVFLQGKTLRLNRVWFIFTISVAIWGFGGMWIGIAKSEAEALLAWRFSFSAGVLWIPILFYHFVTIFCGLGNRKLLVFSYIFGIILFPLILTDYFFEGVRFSFSSFYYSLPGRYVFPFFAIWWIGMVVYSHYELSKAYKTAAPQKRNQIKYFFLATAIGYSGGSLAYLPIFGVELYPYGNFAIIMYPIIMTYAIAKYHLMDISVVVHKGLAYIVLLASILGPVYLIFLVTGRANAFSVPPLLAATIIFSCGLWVFLSNPRGSPNVTFSLACFGVFIWLFCSFMMYTSLKAEEAYFWGKAIYIGVVFIPAFFFHFWCSFLQRRGYGALIKSNYLISSSFLALVPSNLLIDGVYQYSWGYYAKAGVIHPVFLAYFATVSGITLFGLYRGYKQQEKQNPIEARRIKYVFMSFGIAFIGSTDFIQNYGWEIYPSGYVFVSIWVMVVSFAIVRFQLLDISISLNQATLIRCGQFLLIIPLYMIVLMAIRAFTGSMHYMLAGVLVSILPFFSGFVKNIQVGIENMIGKALFREKYDSYDTLKDFSKAMVNILDLKDLNRKILSTLSRVMEIEQVSLYLKDEAKKAYVLAATHGENGDHLKDIKLREEDRLPRYLRESNQMVFKEEMEHWLESYPNEDMKGIINELSAIGSELCIPLHNKDRLIGFLSLGEKANRGMYTREDVNLLSTLAQNAAISLDNALLYEDLKRQKILMRRTDRMRSLETMAGGFAHEIRNPLTSIKTFVQLAPQRRNDEEFVGYFSKVVSEDVQRIERLIQEILDYARYMQPRLTEEDLNEVVESSLYFIGVKAEGRNIRVEKELAEDLPKLRVDRQQLKQVLLNLFLNALDSMLEGGRLVVKTHFLIKANGDPWVQVEVEDTGSGISEDDLEHIFDPFFTTKHESEEREGTGLGLSIVHQIIQEHRGHVDVKSKPNQGTTFLVSLPVNPSRYERRKTEVEKS